MNVPRPHVAADDERERRARMFEISVVIGLLALGFGLRVWWALTIEPEQVSDARGYLRVALEIAEGKGYREDGLPTAYYPVGYSAALALFHTVFGPAPVVARIANAVLGLGTLASLYVAARALTGSRVAGVLCLALFALYPADVAYSSITLSQPAFNTFALAGAALCVYRPEPRAAAVVLGGALLGWATLTRNQGAVLPALLALAWLVDGAARVKQSLLLVAAFAASLAPWTIRNALAFDAFVPVSNNGGINLFIGNNPSARGRYKFSPRMDAQLSAAVTGPRRGGPNEVAIDRYAAQLAYDWVRQQPRAAIDLWKPKLEYLYADDEAPFGYWAKRVPTPEQSERLARGKALNAPYYLLLLGLSALGACVAAVELTVRRKRFASLLWLPGVVVLAFTALHLLTFGDPCYHHPMMPWLAIYAGYALATPWRYRSTLRKRVLGAQRNGLGPT
jgi:4-amino-4-deoxy-L-arabinose transferase-like glycosyltransferase